MRDGAAAALLEALRADPAGRRRRALSSSTPTAGRSPARGGFPGLGTALAQALFLHRWLVTQSGGSEAAGRARSAGSSRAAMLVRREAAEQVGYLDPDFFVYSEEVDFQKRLHDAGWRILHVPARGPSTTSSSPPTAAGAPARSSSSTAAATPTCESTTRRRLGLSAASLGLVLRAARRRGASSRHEPDRYWLTRARRCAPPGRACGRRPRRTTAELGAAHGDPARSGQVPGRSSSRATAS